MSSLYDASYNPDILTCLANLSSDEVFTPPTVANQMLDMLPQELFKNPDTKFLDPGCKSGVFLREIAKRLILGEKNIYPDLNERIYHIMHDQLFGIATTELTSMMSRRSLYCSKYPNGPFSIAKFDTADGNIRYKNLKHTWVNGKCKFCGVSIDQFDRDPSLETHAYEFIHTLTPKEIFNMKFDVIISNPPYHMSDNGNGDSAKPIYQCFVEQAEKLNPRYITMITPSRWFNGGKGLDQFRKKMLNDRHVTKLVDYQNAKDCFPGVSIGGGVSYFLWERDRESSCEITNIVNGKSIVAVRELNEFPVFVRYNESIEIINKIRRFDEKSLADRISSRNPFGLSTNTRGAERADSGSITLYTSQGVSYINRNDVLSRNDDIDKWKVMISRVTSEHAGEPDKTGMYKVIAKMQLLKPGEVCTDSYIICYPTTSENEIQNVFGYLKTKFVRFLLLQTLSSINLTRDQYSLVPLQDFSKEWTDNQLYIKYGFTDDEIAFVDSMIKPIDSASEGGDD